MKRFRISYLQEVIQTRVGVVYAESEQEAKEIVLAGDVDDDELVLEEVRDIFGERIETED